MLGSFRWIQGLLCACATLLVVSQNALAQEAIAAAQAAPRAVTATRLESGERIVLDGSLDEAVWRRGEAAADFIQVDPNNGQPATEPTEVRIAFDADALYLGVTCFDSEPDKWIGFQRGRDQFLNADDRFQWTIDTFLDARSGYFFEMNPSGLMADSLMGSNGDNRQWDGIWDARVQHSDLGWTIEIRIPFRTLNFDPNHDTWGINFQRTVRRKNEDSLWMGWARNQGLRRMTNAGRVTGIREVSQGRGLDIKPYGLLTARASPGRGNADLRGDANAGVDLFYNPTPGMRANLTVNTDFAQTEVDQRQVNLTRFSLFFPERRDFFLDGATFFDFAGGRPVSADSGGGGSSNDQVIPFFSRRIGLTSAGTPQKIDFGTKITGQVGAQDIGLFHVRTGEAEGVPGEDFTVARVKRRVLQQSYVGALYTRRDARVAGGEASETFGLDMRMGTATFLGTQNLDMNAWLIHANRPGVTGHNTAWGGFINYPNDRWSANFSAREVQADFDPAVGFVTRHAYRRYSPAFLWGPRPRDHRYIRRLEFGADAQIYTDLRNQLLERTTPITAINLELHSQDNFGVEITPTYSRLDAPFAISPRITLPMGSRYDYTRVQIHGQTASRRMLSVNGRVETGGFYSGTREQTVLNVTLRAHPGLIFSMNSEWNQVHLAEGEFSTNVYRFVGETQFSPFVTLVNNIQYDTQSALLGWQSRFRWILRPGNDLYVVYTHSWIDQPLLGRFSTLDRQFASKMLYTYRF